jgi:putative Mn2+ efflux pump MntP
MLSLGFLVGIDNLVVAAGLGMLGVRRTRMLWFVVSCACCEAIAPLLGVLIGLGLVHWMGSVGEWVGPLCLVACGLLVMNTVLRRESIGVLDRPGAVILLPLALSLDNLTAGVSLGSGGVHMIVHAASVGLISGFLSTLGWVLGYGFQNSSPAWARVVAGPWFVACAVVCLFVGRN